MPESPTASFTPVSALQKAMAQASSGAPGAGLYVVQDVCELEPGVDPECLRATWRAVSRRHPALRTRLEAGPQGELLQTVESDPEYQWLDEDWSGVSPAEVAAQLERFLERDRARGFQWADGIPMRFAFFRTAERKAILVWSVHHVVLDGRSLTRVWREWLASYAGAALEDAPERERAEAGPSPGDTEAYWREYLQGIGRTAEFITDRFVARSKGPAVGFGRERVSLGAEETAAAHESARRLGITAHTLVQGAWALLLGRYSGREDVVFGVTRAARDSVAVGMGIRTLPLHVRIDGAAPAAQWLQALRAQWRMQRTFEDAPLEQVCRWGGLATGIAPFDSLLTYEHAPPIETLRQFDAAWKKRTLRRVQKPDVPLTLAAHGGPEFSVEAIYDRRLFCQETMGPFAGHLRELLRSLVAHPDSPLGELNMLPAAERRWLVEDVNRTTAPFPADLRAQHLFEQQAARQPGHAAVEWDGGSMSYAELNRRANGIAWRLIELGAGPDDLVGVSLERSPKVVSAMLGVFKAGAAFLALPPDLPEERLNGMLAATRPKVVLAEGARREWFEARGATVMDATDALGGRDGNPPTRAGLDDAAYAIYTSGSTGRPKAAVLTHRGLVNLILGATAKLGICATDRRLQFAALGTDVFVSEVCCALSRGATLVLYLPEAGCTVSGFLQVLRERRITIASVASSWGGEWVAAMGGGAPLPATLRAVVMGMERVPPASFEAWRNLARGRLRWFNAYGPSETSALAAIYEAGTSEWEGGDVVPIGRPLENVRAYVLDEARTPVPAGLPGELYVGGEGVGRGYLSAPERDIARFMADPFMGGAGRMYRTGDLVYRLPDCNLVFIGRVDRQVKIRGFRVEVEEIEAALAAHPGVRQCAVVLAETGSREMLAAYVAPHPGAEAGPAQWRAHLKRLLPEHMLPAGFVVLDQLPTTPGGKIDRQALPPFEPAREDAAAGTREPATVLERDLTELWREALGADRARPDDSFFELGGDSLAAARLIVSIEKLLGRELPLAALLRAPTPARMAALLEKPASEQGAAAAGPFLKLKPEGSRPPVIWLSTLLEGPRIYRRLAENMEPEQPFYLLPVKDPEPWRKVALHEVAHEVCQTLRTAMGNGPFILGGYCRWGLAAHAAAQELRAAGAKVRLLVLFDVPAPGYPKVLRSAPGYVRQGRQWLRGRAGFDWPEIGRHLKTVFRMAGRRPAMNYRPAAAGFPVIQFLARDPAMTTRVFEDPRLSWRELCPAGFEAYEVAVQHDRPFEPQAADAIAARLTEKLRQLDAAR